MSEQPTLARHQTVRRAFPILDQVVYLNVGTYGIMPEPALRRFIEMTSAFERAGVAHPGRLRREIQDARARIGRLLKCDADCIAFTGNATDGVNLVLSGLQWAPGDEVVTTDQEHESIIHPLLHLHRCRGIRIRRVGVSPDPQVMRARCEAVLSPRTRLVAFSHVTCETGARLPAKAICDWAAQRGILSLVDGAQSLGVLPIDVGELGCDFFTSNGHKWLCGPKGTGIFYARSDRMTELCPAHVGAGSLERADVETGQADLWPIARRFEFGTRAHALYAGLGASLAWLEGLGWENIERHVARMSDALKAGIRERPWLRLLTPLSFDESSGLTAFSVADRPAGEVSVWLRENAQIHVRVVPHYNALRVSTPCFVNEQDIAALLAALDELQERQ